MQIFLQILLAVSVACFAGAVYWKYHENSGELLNPEMEIDIRRHPELELQRFDNIDEELLEVYSDYIDVPLKMKINKMLKKYAELGEMDFGQEAYMIVGTEYMQEFLNESRKMIQYKEDTESSALKKLSNLNKEMRFENLKRKVTSNCDVLIKGLKAICEGATEKDEFKINTALTRMHRDWEM